MKHSKNISSIKGSRIYRTEMDLLLHRCKFYLTFQENKDNLQFYELDCREVIRFTYSKKVSKHMYHVTIADIQYKKEENHHLTLQLWDENHIIEIECKKLSCDLIAETGF